MSKDRDPWRDARRAWARLHGWHQDGPAATPAHPDDGNEALTALADIGLLRHLLDEAELVAVRTARWHNKSWAEIAVKLGITRQSAWERWRDLDEGEPQIAPEVIGRVAGDLRRRSSVIVPNVVGMQWDQARELLQSSGFDTTTPDAQDLMALVDSRSPVTDQSPESGARVPAGSLVTLWVGRGGGSAGVREPRRPKPTPKTARELHYESTDQQVS